MVPNQCQTLTWQIDLKIKGRILQIFRHLVVKIECWQRFSSVIRGYKIGIFGQKWVNNWDLINSHKKAEVIKSAN